VARLTARGSKAKGDRFERELATYINESVGTNAVRAPLSGGGSVFASGGADLLGVPGMFIEAKRVERLNFHDAIRQAERNKAATGCPDIPVVINRKNHQTTGESLCVLRLDDLLNLYRYYLQRDVDYSENKEDAVIEVSGHGRQSSRKDFEPKRTGRRVSTLYDRRSQGAD
jgi:hypothetical protein